MTEVMRRELSFLRDLLRREVYYTGWRRKTHRIAQRLIAILLRPIAWLMLPFLLLYAYLWEKSLR